MPEEGSNTRASLMAYVKKTQHKVLTSAHFHELIEYLQQEENLNKMTEVEKAVLKVIAKDHNKKRKIPERLVEELAETTTKAFSVWVRAKAKNDFNSFAPYLEKIVLLKRQEAECVGHEGSPYNALLDEYETKMTTEKLDKIFTRLKQELVPIIRAIKESSVKIDESFLCKKYDRQKQLDLCRAVLRHLGFDFQKGRLDETEHPFMSGFSPNDGRITTHVYEDKFFDAISSSTHECGHWLYQNGIDSSLYKTPLWDGTSLGIHESQSRLYETIIGQGLPFWKYFFPVLKHTFPEQLGSVTLDDFYKAINIVEPFFIRIQSDELTYQMHIILRYEIEKDLIEGKIKVQDLPTIWNQKMNGYLGIMPENDSKGVLQDVHWSGGGIGYFPTYTLGNLYAAQFYNQAKKEIPDLEERIEKGDMMTLRNWLKEKIHKYGKLETPDEIVKRVTGEELNPDYFIRYIKEKYSKIYGLSL
jgi:carboxypeptidase Taq